MKLLFWRKNKKENQPEGSTPPDNRNRKPNTLVVDLCEGFALEYVEKPEGRVYWYKNNPVYLMSRAGSGGALKTINRPETIDVLPEKLYRALNWMECKLLFAIKSTLLEKLQFGAMLILIVILLFFMFLIMSSAGVI